MFDVNVAAYQIVGDKCGLIQECQCHHEYHDGINPGMNEFVEGSQSYYDGNDEYESEYRSIVIVGVYQDGSQDSEERQQGSQQVGSRVSSTEILPG